MQDVLVKEGDFVAAGQPLARMQVDTLLAQRAEAVAQQQRAINGVASAAAQTAQRESDWRPRPWWRSARASWTPRAGAWRAPKPSREGASSIQELDDDRAACAASRPPCMPRAPR